MRDNFTIQTKNTLAKRVTYICSNPDCRIPTCGPTKNPEKASMIGIASHISAAAPGGPRYSSSMSQEERKSISNGIWLCCNCSTLIDRDEEKYTIHLLNHWKELSEKNALNKLGRSSLSHDWASKLGRQTSKISTVEFGTGYLANPKSSELNEYLSNVTRPIYDIIAWAYLDCLEKNGIEEISFILTIMLEEEDGKYFIDGYLQTHLTNFAYVFGKFFNFIKNQDSKGYLDEAHKYANLRTKREVVFGESIPHKVYRTNPAKVTIENLSKTEISLNKDLTTSELIIFLANLRNRPFFIANFDFLKYPKNANLVASINEKLSLNDIKIDIDNPEKWSIPDLKD